jgi:hypothetical protein
LVAILFSLTAESRTPHTRSYNYSDLLAQGNSQYDLYCIWDCVVSNTALCLQSRVPCIFLPASDTKN